MNGWTVRGYDRLVIWADREHSANLAYLTGFDPRFEEAMLIVGPTGSRRSSPATSAMAPPRPLPCPFAPSASRT